MDGRSLSIPLWWIPSLHNATPEAREMYTINRSRTMLLWDSDKCAINDELRVMDYLGTAPFALPNAPEIYPTHD